VYNFESRRTGTLFSDDGKALVEYRTDVDGKLVDLYIDHLVTVEEMILFNPNINFEYTIPGFDGEIFTKPSGRCTNISNTLKVPINLEIGNTRYKYDDSVCMYKTVDNNNNFRPGFATEYYLTSYVREKRATDISIIVYQPDELVKFVEISRLPHTFKSLGIYTTKINLNSDNVEVGHANYYNDMCIYEQLYLKHQNNKDTIDQINGLSTSFNLLDLDHLSEIVPMIYNFEIKYDSEISALEKLQEEIGINFATPDNQENPSS
jgi:hypothetical protein